jgi:hypothetical protein
VSEGDVCRWLILYTHPLAPPAFAEAATRRQASQTGLLSDLISGMFERGKEY